MRQAHLREPTSEKITPILLETADKEVRIGTMSGLLEMFSNLGFVPKGGNPQVFFSAHDPGAVRFLHVQHHGP